MSIKRTNKVFRRNSFVKSPIAIRNVMQKLKITYMVALTVIGLVISISQYLVQNSIRKGEVDSRTINISGRQRMLSQKITKASLAMANSTSQEQFEKRKQELTKAYDLLKTSHYGLQHGDASMNLIDVNNSEEILVLFGKISPYYERIEGAVNELLRYRNFEKAKDTYFHEQVQIVLDNEASFLKLMNDITFEYDAESTSRISDLSDQEGILFLIAILLLFLEAILVFRPAVRQLGKYTSQILEKTTSLEVSLKNEQFLTNQSKSIFDNVKQGLLLLDRDLMIGNLYSKEVETIFEAKGFAGNSFIKLFRSRLVGRDLESLEMFSESLFDKTIQESVLNKLNPIEQVELYTSNQDPNLRKRFVKVNFSRIIKDGEIFRVLVTIQDETELILMQKQIEEAKEKNKEETDQLMAILKVDPKLLKNFLGQSIGQLQTISSLYENHRDQNYRPLISQTFNTVHAVKGNSTLLELTTIESRLHEVEEHLVLLRDARNVEGKDFLKILFKVTEVLNLLNNMNEIMKRMAQIYNVMERKEGLTGDNVLLKDMVKRSVTKISKELNKNVTLDFDESSIILPDEHKLHIKDALIQLIRNSIVHGIESQDERLSSGKPAVGKIKCGIYEGENGKLVLNYEDDGKGLDVNKISKKALERNIVDENQLKLMSQDEIYGLIFMESFSTQESATVHAGRGQGLSIIKSIADKYNAEIKLDSEPGKRFKIDLVWQ